MEGQAGRRVDGGRGGEERGGEGRGGKGGEGRRVSKGTGDVYIPQE